MSYNLRVTNASGAEIKLSSISETHRLLYGVRLKEDDFVKHKDPALGVQALLVGFGDGWSSESTDLFYVNLEEITHLHANGPTNRQYIKFKNPIVALRGNTPFQSWEVMHEGKRMLKVVVGTQELRTKLKAEMDTDLYIDVYYFVQPEVPADNTTYGLATYNDEGAATIIGPDYTSPKIPPPNVATALHSGQLWKPMKYVGTLYTNRAGTLYSPLPFPSNSESREPIWAEQRMGMNTDVGRSEHTHTKLFNFPIHVNHRPLYTYVNLFNYVRGSASKGLEIKKYKDTFSEEWYAIAPPFYDPYNPWSAQPMPVVIQRPHLERLAIKNSDQAAVAKMFNDLPSYTNIFDVSGCPVFIFNPGIFLNTIY